MSPTIGQGVSKFMTEHQYSPAFHVPISDRSQRDRSEIYLRNVLRSIVFP